MVRVAECLSRQQSKIEGVELVDPMDAFPKRWREALAKLPVRSVRNFGLAADADTVPGKLQIALKSAHEAKKPNGKIVSSDDGSLRVVRGESGLVAARWVVQALASREAEVAVVAKQNEQVMHGRIC